MRITEEEARTAGELVSKISWTDNELTLMIRTIKLVVAHLEGRGPTWQRDVVFLRRELYDFEGFVLARQREGSNNERCL